MPASDSTARRRCGWVESLGWGLGEGDVDPTTGLPKTHQGTGGWLASAQRFPVDLAFETGDGAPRGVRYNARPSVIFYTGEHPSTSSWREVPTAEPRR